MRFKNIIIYIMTFAINLFFIQIFITLPIHYFHNYLLIYKYLQKYFLNTFNYFLLNFSKGDLVGNLFALPPHQWESMNMNTCIKSTSTFFLKHSIQNFNSVNIFIKFIIRYFNIINELLLNLITCRIRSSRWNKPSIKLYIWYI